MDNQGKLIIIVGKYNGLGGVQTIHKNLNDFYINSGYQVILINSLQSFLIYFFRMFNYNTEVVYFSGLSLFFAPFFLGKGKHVFFTHGFYIYEGIKNPIRNFKKYFYELHTSFFLYFYKWVYCISPTPISSLVNSILYSRKTYTIPWAVTPEFTKFEIKNNFYKYHLTFLGRPNTQKLEIRSIRLILILLKKQKIIAENESITIAFVVPYLNNHLYYIQDTLKKEYKCSIYNFVKKNNFEVSKVLSYSLYSFNCFEWEAFGLTHLESLCMGCNILLPINSPIISLIDIFPESPIYKFAKPGFFNGDLINSNLKLSNKRLSNELVQKYRSIFKWDIIINEIHKIIDIEYYEK